MRSTHRYVFVLGLASMATIVAASCGKEDPSLGAPPQATSLITSVAATSSSSGVGGSNLDGGEDASACTDGGECPSHVCSAQGLCAPASCNDMVKNGDETDVDCGGSCMTKCADMKSCDAGGDCVSLVCTQSICITATCNDKVKNGTETDIDCGGSCKQQCSLNQSCTTATDCISNECDATLHTCNCPLNMVKAPVNTGPIADFCIDATEVTNQSFDAFYLNNTPANFQQDPAVCAWNDDFTPSMNWPPSEDDAPVVFVDWCDAAAYCKWKKKHLCGNINGGTNAPTDYANPAKSEWFDACSSEGNHAYPYSGAYDNTKCNGADTPLDGGPAGPINVVSDSMDTPIQNACLGGVLGLFEMSGNVAEWEDSCDGATGASDNCQVRGGSYKDGQSGLTCASNVTAARNDGEASIGFRCCL